VGAFPDLRIYVAVTSPYPWNRGVTKSIKLSGVIGSENMINKSQESKRVSNTVF